MKCIAESQRLSTYEGHQKVSLLLVKKLPIMALFVYGSVKHYAQYDTC